jgi:7,8-dihydropterin-6-yl-methyl-4-(beta-D-ribofuranosyl)aminobenzene 5'-phosphate synthase
MKASILILVENTSPTPGIVGEYGFSALLEIDGRYLLFDTGHAGAIFENARQLHVDLNAVEAVVLSHGHFDHSGALQKYLELYGPKKVYVHSGAFARRPRKTRHGYEEIGSPCSEAELIKAGARFEFVDSFTEIFPGIFLSGSIPRYTDYEDVGGFGTFKIEIDGQIKDDLIEDDMALYISHPRGTIILSGCAHAGVVNTIHYARAKLADSRVLAYIGGTHLMGAAPGRLQKTAEALREIKAEKLIVAHCTGFDAAAYLRQELGESLVKGEAGMKFIFE